MTRIALIGLFLTCLLFAQTWTQRASIPTPRWYPASVVVDEKIYVIGGQDSTEPYSSLNTIEVYDPIQDTWETKRPMINDRWGLMAAVVNGKIYAIGGRTGSFTGGHSPTNVVEEYNPISDTWIPKSLMPTARGYGGCGVFHDTIYVFGGRAGSTVSMVEKYCPATDSWSSDPSMLNPRYTFATAFLNDRFYLIGGWNTTYVEEYNPMTKVWTVKTPMPTARGGSGVGVINGKIFVVGGRGGNSNELESYDPVNDTWRTWNPMPTAREGLAAGVVDNKLYCITGSVPINQGGLPYYGENEVAEGLAGIDEDVIRPSNDNTFLLRFSNPFNTSNQVYYRLIKDGNINLAVYDALGNKVKLL
ncbi:MAG: Kelch repeat-containing protein, partial [bacterium]